METKRIKLIIPTNNEPDWGNEDKLFEKPINMIISAQIANLTPGKQYAVLKFESAANLPS